MLERWKKLNEELSQILNEISDETKQSYLQKRQAQLNNAKKAMEKANKAVKKSNARQVAGLPKETDKETAVKALKDLQYEMKKIDSGSDWRLEEQEDEICLSVRYWGNWEGDDGSGDYDWQSLSNGYEEKLNSILTNIQKKYNVQIHQPGSEKNWLDFIIGISKNTYGLTKEQQEVIKTDVINELVDAYDDIAKVKLPSEEYLPVFLPADLANAINNYKDILTIAYSPSDDIGLSIYVNEEDTPSFNLAWSPIDNRLYIHKYWDEDQQIYHWEEYTYLDQQGLVVCSLLDDNLTIPQSNDDCYKFAAQALKDIEKLLPIFVKRYENYM